MKVSVVMAVVFGATLVAYGGVGDQADFEPARDWSNAAGDGLYVNFGGRNAHRAYKWNWQEGLVMDWYTPFHMGANTSPKTSDPRYGQPWDQIQAMKDLINNTWQVDWAGGERVRFQLRLRPGFGEWVNDWPLDMHPTTPMFRYEIWGLDLQDDWAEGDGISGSAPFNWTKSVGAATNAYAQTYYTDTDGVPGTFDEVLDTANCVPWTSGTGSTHPTFQSHYDSFRRSQNGVYNEANAVDPYPAANEPIYLYVDPMEAVATGNYVSVDLQHDYGYPGGGWPDMPIMNHLLNGLLNNNHQTDTCRGLILGRCYYLANDEQWYVTDGQNNRFYTLEQNPSSWPYLRLTHLPIPGDATGEGDVDGADYTAWADHYDPNGSGVTAWADGGWTIGNFTDDDVVDGADYTAWADNYSPATSVPEPGFAVLLACGGLALLRRRVRK
jgi:hypothetical protein